jgi:hypothetical protein
MLLISKSLRSTATAADQLNKEAQLGYEQQHKQETVYPLLDLCEEKATISTNANASKITNNNTLADKINFSTPISHHQNRPMSKSAPGSEFHHNCPPTTIPTSPTNSHNRIPDPTKTIQPHSLKKKLTSSATTKPALKLTRTGISSLSTMDVKEAPIESTASTFLQLYERKKTTDNNSLWPSSKNQTQSNIH